MVRSKPLSRPPSSQPNGFLAGAFNAGGSSSNKPSMPTPASRSARASPKKQQRVLDDHLLQEEEDARKQLLQLELLLESFELEG